MTFLANTTVALIGGGEVQLNDLGDEVPSDVVVPDRSKVPASLIERTRDVYDPATGERRTVRKVVARLYANVPVSEDMRIKDNATGKLYAVEEITASRSIAGMATLTLDLTDTRG